MNNQLNQAEGLSIPCCPELVPDKTCDRLDFTRVLQMPITTTETQGRYLVKLFLHFRIERCPGALTLGDPAYSTTLLPGEKVRLFVQDRRSSFTYDKETKVAYRHQHMSEDQYYMRAFRASYARSEAEQTGKYSSEYTEKQAQLTGEIGGGFFGDLFGAPSMGTSNSSFSSSAVSSYANRQVASFYAADSQAVSATRLTNSISVGEVTSRTQIEGSTEEHFESSSRVYENYNRCHAVTYIFYRINKQQTVTFSLVDITRELVTVNGTDLSNLDPDQLEKTYREVDRRLAVLGILNPDGSASQEYMKRFFAQQVSSIPTPGVIVKGCLDNCNVCEPLLEERYKLENEMFKKQIDLLEQSQEYRCCPDSCEEEE